MWIRLFIQQTKVTGGETKVLQYCWDWSLLYWNVALSLPLRRLQAPKRETRSFQLIVARSLIHHILLLHTWKTRAKNHGFVEDSGNALSTEVRVPLRPCELFGANLGLYFHANAPCRDLVRESDRIRESLLPKRTEMPTMSGLCLSISFSFPIELSPSLPRYFPRCGFGSIVYTTIKWKQAGNIAPAGSGEIFSPHVELAWPERRKMLKG